MCTRSAAPRPQDTQQTERAAFERLMGSRRSWRRLAKRAVSAFERDLAARARRVAAAAPPVLVATSRPLRGEAAAAVVALSLVVPGWSSSCPELRRPPRPGWWLPAAMPCT